MWGTIPAILRTILAMFVASVPSITVAQTVEEEQAVACPHHKGWKPARLPRILAEHRKWAERLRAEDFSSLSSLWKESFSQGRANLCNADLSFAELNQAELSGAELSGANLVLAELNQAELTKAILSGAYLTAAKLNGANLGFAKLNGAELMVAELNQAELKAAKLNGAELSGAQLSGAGLGWAELNGAKLVGAKLNGANLGFAKLAGARLSGADLTGAIYAPDAPPPDPFVAGIKGLQTVTFPKGQEIGLVQLRELIQKAGLRDLEREATYAIERVRTRHALAEWKADSVRAAEGVFRFVFFEATTAYGLRPARALIIIVTLWAVLILIYFWPIRLPPKQTDRAIGIYRIWLNDRIEVSQGAPTADNPTKVERVQGSAWTALGWAAYFSLLSAFHIGFREFNIGTWLARLQAHEYVLKPIGWVRVVSGAQSLISVYLLAIWALTYFGRPFQ